MMKRHEIGEMISEAARFLSELPNAPEKAPREQVAGFKVIGSVSVDRLLEKLRILRAEYDELRCDLWAYKYSHKMLSAVGQLDEDAALSSMKGAHKKAQEANREIR